ncbi:MAG: hypothetical protein E7620_05150 [Ruminococcaceae bacterium]|nr:hypothetical protein [Oscillospiraceae bacterium]
MSIKQIRAFVSEYDLMQGKSELPCPQFTNDLAVIDPSANNTVLASRGLFLKAGSPLRLSKGETDFLISTLAHASVAAVLTRHGVLLAFGQLLQATSLLPVLLLHGDAHAHAEALRLLAEKDILCSPAVIDHARSGGKVYDAYLQITDALSLCNRCFCPSNEDDFRLHCAQIAQLAGCRINVTPLPLGHFPLSRSDRLRWIMFCLCCFLTLRGDSAEGPSFRMESAPHRAFRAVMEHHSEYKRKKPIETTHFGFLSLPCFQNFTLKRRSDGGFEVEALMRRQCNEGILLADSARELYRVSLLFAPEAACE